jgi:hypothetical protein
MSELRAWIRADREPGDGTLHLLRAVAIAEAAVREGIATITFVTTPEDASLVRDLLPSGVELEEWEAGLTEPQEAARLAERAKQVAPRRVDERHPRPLVYLVGNRFRMDYQEMIWKAGAELVLVADRPLDTFADWCILPTPYGGELGMKSGHGYTRFLRGGHYAPLREEGMKAIHTHREHRTQAEHFAISTENLDYEAWLPALGKALASLEPTKYVEGEWSPRITIIPGPDDPGDEELKGMLGDTGPVPVQVASDRLDTAGNLLEVDLLFAPHNPVLAQSLALGTVRIALPQAGVEEDMMKDHLEAREASIPIPDPGQEGFAGRMEAVLTRASFDAAWRRGQNRVGQYLCDGLGSIRIVRQTAFKVFTVPQNIIRFFEMGDPRLKQL